MDSLFKNKKSKAIKKPEKPAAKPAKTMEKAEKKDTGAAKKSRKFTEDGLKIYTMEELKIGQGGNTEDCPFDCDCCF